MNYAVSLLAGIALFAACSEDRVVEDPKLIVSVDKYVASASGDKFSVTVTSNVEWSAKSTDEWVTLSPVSAQAGTLTVALLVEENPTNESREATITITGLVGDVAQTITVTQVKPGDVALSVSPEKINTSGDGGHYTLNVSSDKEWSLTSKSSWFTVLPAKGPVGKTDVTVTIAANTEKARTDTIIITAGDVTKIVEIYQGAKNNVILAKSGTFVDDANVTSLFPSETFGVLSYKITFVSSGTLTVTDKTSETNIKWILVDSVGHYLTPDEYKAQGDGKIQIELPEGTYYLAGVLNSGNEGKENLVKYDLEIFTTGAGGAEVYKLPKPEETYVIYESAGVMGAEEAFRISFPMPEGSSPALIYTIKAQQAGKLKVNSGTGVLNMYLYDTKGFLVSDKSPEEGGYEWYINTKDTLGVYDCAVSQYFLVLTPQENVTPAANYTLSITYSVQGGATVLAKGVPYTPNESYFTEITIPYTNSGAFSDDAVSAALCPGDSTVVNGVLAYKVTVTEAGTLTVTDKIAPDPANIWWRVFDSPYALGCVGAIFDNNNGTASGAVTPGTYYIVGVNNAPWNANLLTELYEVEIELATPLQEIEHGGAIWADRDATIVDGTSIFTSYPNKLGERNEYFPIPEDDPCPEGWRLPTKAEWKAAWVGGAERVETIAKLTDEDGHVLALRLSDDIMSLFQAQWDDDYIAVVAVWCDPICEYDRSGADAWHNHVRCVKVIPPPPPPANAATEQLWIVGGKAWSDVINIPECDKDDFDASPAGCRKNADGYSGYYYSWDYVDANKETLCPEGWHVPTKNEFISLNVALGGNGEYESYPNLADDYQTKWSPSYGGRFENGVIVTDDVDTDYYLGVTAYYWSSVANGDSEAWGMQVDGGNWYDIKPYETYSKSFGLQVRCIQN
jgi:uncharacterized protein (TIGR02145 family)